MADPGLIFIDKIGGSDPGSTITSLLGMAQEKLDRDLVNGLADPNIPTYIWDNRNNTALFITSLMEKGMNGGYNPNGIQAQGIKMFEAYPYEEWLRDPMGTELKYMQMKEQIARDSVSYNENRDVQLAMGNEIESNLSNTNDLVRFFNDTDAIYNYGLSDN